MRAADATAGIPFVFLTAKGDQRDFREGINPGADDYLTKPFEAADLLTAIRVRPEKQRDSELIARKKFAFKPNFDSPAPLQALGLTPREAEVLLWVAQGKSNPEIEVILDLSVKTVKKHLEHVFQTLGVESRTAATLRAGETAARRPPGRRWLKPRSPHSKDNCRPASSRRPLTPSPSRRSGRFTRRSRASRKQPSR